jgi:hypothetical protein
LIFFIRKPVFVGGLSLTVLVVLYLLFQRTLYFAKEIFVAVLYTAGVLLPSLTVTPITLTSFHFGFMLQFFLIALVNLMIFSWFDAEKDFHDNLASFVTRFGKRFTAIIIWTLFFLLAAVNVFLFISLEERIALGILSSMTITLLLIFLFPDYFKRNEVYRLLGDAVFYFPMLIWLWPRN